MNMYSLKLAGVSVREALREIMRYLFLGLLVSAPLIIAKYYLLPTISLMLIAIGVSGIYYLIIVLSDEQLKLYKLIWQRFVACQMTPAQWNVTEALIEARSKKQEAGPLGVFKATGRSLAFDGFTRVRGASSSPGTRPTVRTARAGPR